jgi:hypothetical protein
MPLCKITKGELEMSAHHHTAWPRMKNKSSSYTQGFSAISPQTDQLNSPGSAESPKVGAYHQLGRQVSDWLGDQYNYSKLNVDSKIRRKISQKSW